MSRGGNPGSNVNDESHKLRINIANSSPDILRQAVSNRQIRHIEIFVDFAETKIADKSTLWEPWSDLDLTIIEDMVQLESFTFMAARYDIDVWKLDFSPLARHANLERVEIRGYLKDADLSPLSECKNLKKLSVQMLNSKSSISFLSDIPVLSTLELQIDAEPRFDFSPVSECIELTDCTLSCRDYVDASALSKCPKLETLHVGPIGTIHESGWGVSAWSRRGGRSLTYGVTLPSNESLRFLDLSENHLTYPHWVDSKARKRIKESEQLDLLQVQGCSGLERINLQMNGLVLIDLEPITDIQRKESEPLPIIDLRYNFLIAVNTGGYSSFPDRILVDAGVKCVKDNASVSLQYGLAFEDGLTRHIDEDFIFWLEDDWEK